MCVPIRWDWYLVGVDPLPGQPRVRVPVWELIELTDDELEPLAAQYAAERNALHGAELQRFHEDRRLSLRDWLRLYTDRPPPDWLRLSTDRPPPCPAALLARPMGEVMRLGVRLAQPVKIGVPIHHLVVSAVWAWLRRIGAARREADVTLVTVCGGALQLTKSVMTRKFSRNGAVRA